jgi:hypothetical protein
MEAVVRAARGASRFCDIGVNLLDPMFRGVYGHGGSVSHPPDVDAVLARAAAAGVEQLIVTGVAGVLTVAVSVQR